MKWFRLSPRDNKLVRQELDNMLKAKTITPASSAWSFPAIIATKKDGKPRFCVDYRTLNSRMKTKPWPIPQTQEIFDALGGSRVFTTLDLFSGYRQIRMAEDCKEKTAFICRFGTFQFEVMPFGLMNAPFTFQKVMDHLFNDLEFVHVYLDDIVIASKNIGEHEGHLNLVLSRLK